MVHPLFLYTLQVSLSVSALSSSIMDPHELIAVSGQLAGVAAAIPFTSIVKRMLGPAADEIAERVRDEIKLYRYGRQLSMLSKAEKLAKDAGFTPKAVPVKTLFALLDGASLEENEDLHDKWASLLANAANPTVSVPVRPSFVDTLKLLTPEAAKLLDAAYAKAGEDPRGPASHDRVSGRTWEPYDEQASQPVEEETSLKARERTLRDLGGYADLYGLYCALGFTKESSEAFLTSVSSVEEMERDEHDRQQFAVVMDELTRFQMWSVTQGRASGDRFYLTSYAVQFVRACAAPLPVSPPAA